MTGVSTPSILSISAAYDFAVVLGADGTVWAWGRDEAGQLDNTPGNPVGWPMQITGRYSGITQVSGGFDHVLALKSNGTVLAWGDNGNGELGDGGTASVTGPVQVSGLANATQVSAGGYFSLAIHIAPLLILAPNS